MFIQNAQWEGGAAFSSKSRQDIRSFPARPMPSSDLISSEWTVATFIQGPWILRSRTRTMLSIKALAIIVAARLSGTVGSPFPSLLVSRPGQRV